MNDMIIKSYGHFLATQETLQQLVNLCTEMNSQLTDLRAQVAELTAMRDTINAVSTIEEPVDTCTVCHGTGYWQDNLGQNHFCWTCKGKVQS